MTEQHGVNTVCVPQEPWDAFVSNERLTQMGRQGVRIAVADEMIVDEGVSQESGSHARSLCRRLAIVLPSRGTGSEVVGSAGEIAAEHHLAHHSGDLAAVHDNGYIEIKDRSKDIIISGGEKGSSLEAEVLYTHPAVLGAAVVAAPDEQWGEVACAAAVAGLVY
jgi:fatty-acyl-CoA synthase